MGDDFDEATSNEIFERIDRDRNLSAQLATGSKVFDYIMGIQDFRRHIRIALEKIHRIAEDTATAVDSARALENLAHFSFYLFGIGSVHLSLENLLYCGACDLDVAQVFHPILDRWKYSAPVQIVKNYRNRLQHRYYAAPRVDIQQNTMFHPDGPLQTVSFTLDVEELEKVLDKIKMDGGLRDACRAFLNEKVKNSPIGLIALFEEYESSVGDVVSKLQTALRESHAAQFEITRALIEELDQIRVWLSEHGVSDPRQPSIDVIERPVRQWLSLPSPGASG